MPETSSLEITPRVKTPDRTRDFIEVNGSIKRRPHRHSRGSLTSDDVAYHKGLDVKERVSNFDLKQQIEEGIQEFEEERNNERELITQIWEDWDENEIERADIREVERTETNNAIEEPSGISHTDPVDVLVSLKQRHGQEGLQRVERFKSDLIELQRTIAQAITSINYVISEEPDLSVDEIMDVVIWSAGDTNKLPPSVISRFRSSIESYVLKHQVVQEYATLSPSDLFSASFGGTPYGDVKVEKGPMTLNLIVSEPHDYVFAYHWWDFLNSQRQITDEDERHALSSGGVAFSSVRDPRLQGVIIMENATNGKRQPDYVRVHEEQHQFNKLFSPVEKQLAENDILIGTIGNPNLTREVALDRLISQYLRLQRKIMGIDTRARDEFIAYLTNGRDPYEIVQILLNSPLYDYPKQYEDRIRRSWRGLRSEVKVYNESAMQLNDPLSNTPNSGYTGTEYPVVHDISYQEITQDVVSQYIDHIFGRGTVSFIEDYVIEQGSDYQEELSSWSNAVSELTRKGYATHEILPLLYINPASSWVKLAKRFPDRYSEVKEQ